MSTPETATSACAAPLTWALTAGGTSHHRRHCSAAKVSTLLLYLQAGALSSAEGGSAPELPPGLLEDVIPEPEDIDHVVRVSMLQLLACTAVTMP